MPDVDVLVWESLGEISAGDEAGGPHGGRRRGWRGRRVNTLLVGAVLGAAVGGFVLLRSGDPGTDDRPAVDRADPLPSPTGGVFSSPTGVVLLFDDGYDGVSALDLDRGVVGRRVVEGQHAGDAPHRMVRASDALIIGWDPVYAAPLSGAASVALGGGIVWFPAVEPGAVWVEVWSGGGWGRGELRLRLVDTNGRTLLEGAGPPTERVEVFVAVPGGVAFATADGVRIWDVAAGRFTATLPAGRPLVATTDGRLIWCRYACTSLMVRDLTTGADVAIPLPDRATAYPPTPSQVSLSPDGTKLALVLSVTDGSERIDAPVEVAVVDLAAELATVVSEAPRRFLSSVSWSQHGTQIFWSSYSHLETTSDVTRYDLVTGRVETVTLPFGGVVGAVVAVTPADARSFLPVQLAAPSGCPAPSVHPSGRVGTCGFRVTATTP